MSNPNALIYQWMVAEQNAYWLDFFLRRDINVFVWNQRGYGESHQSIFSPLLTPLQSKVDAERILQFLVNKLQVRGKIGVYGRSIGGIAASHLVKKFPEIISMFVGDRTMGNFDNVVKYRKPCGSSQMIKLYRLISCNWRINNADGFPENTNCFKIHCFDEYDDVIDVFGSQHHEIASKVAQINYDTKDFYKFYQSIIVIYEIES